MYVRTKIVKNILYYYVAETERKNGKVRQKHLAYLGTHMTLTAAIARLKEEILADLAKAEAYRTRAEEIWRKSKKTANVELKCRECRIQASIFDKRVGTKRQKLDRLKALLARAPQDWQDEI